MRSYFDICIPANPSFLARSAALDAAQLVALQSGCCTAVHPPAARPSARAAEPVAQRWQETCASRQENIFVLFVFRQRRFRFREPVCWRTCPHRWQFSRIRSELRQDAGVLSKTFQPRRVVIDEPLLAHAGPVISNLPSELLPPLRHFCYSGLHHRF